MESSFALTEKVNFDGNINLNSTGKTYWDESNSDAFTTSAYQLLDARASVSFDNVKFTIWGNNILDKQYYTEYVPGSLFGGFDDFGWRGRPATYGASVSINF